ncbi:acyl-CoA dehydrogenase family protein [Streptomyces sp. SID10815]|uniref:acyl-CoA dehydrogenase family protein n=1 Tax=Streptomyces sp. SID10815 TaxID=2706027 RepID=UPI001EF36B30|nr:acyl-CoA dehydrogenase family protein [Streptomyces sp. SID10815]
MPDLPATDPAGTPAADGAAPRDTSPCDTAPRDTAMSGSAAWAALGAAGHLTRVYRGGDVRRGIDVDGLADVLATADARWSVPATLSASVQLATALPVLATGTGPAVEHALTRALSGTATLALAATDTTAGTDLTALRTEAAVDATGVVVTGGKEWITNATTAESFLVLARHRPGRHFANFTWVLVPADAPGVAVRPARSALYAGSGAGHVSFDAVRLGREHLVGRVGFGLPVFARHIAVERLAGALWGVALCRRVLDGTRRRLTGREHREGTLWSRGHVRQRFAAALVRVRELHALTERSAPAVAGHYDLQAAATLKAAAGTTVPYVLGECAHLWGAAGFADGGMQEIRAQAALFGIGGGTTEVVLETVAEGAERVLGDLSRAVLPL